MEEPERAEVEKPAKESDVRKEIELVKLWSKIEAEDKNFKKKKKQIKELVRVGIPPDLRGRIWMKMIGNHLNITNEIYQFYMNRAQAVRTKKRKQTLGCETSVNLIGTDLHRTFPYLSVFQSGGAYCESLREVLEVWVCYRPDIGYVQGMSFVAGVLLLYMEPEDAFTCLANLLCQPFFLSFYRMKEKEVLAILGALDKLLDHFLPTLNKHFKAMGVSLEVFAVDWFLTIYSRSFPLAFTSQVWDNFFHLKCDVRYLFKVAIGIISSFEQTLLKSDFEEILHLLGRVPHSLDATKVLQICEGLVLTQERFRSVLLFDLKTVALV